MHGRRGWALQAELVDDVAEGSKFGREQDWITPQGYFRERRGGRHLGVDDMYFGASARERQLRDGEAKLRDIEARLREIAGERKAALARASDAEAVLRGASASSQLADRADEFAEARDQQARLREDVQRTADSHVAAEAHYEAVREKRLKTSNARDNAAREQRDVQRQLADAARQYHQLRGEQVERLKAFRAKRAHVPLHFRSRAATAALRGPALIEQYAKVSGVASPGTPEDYAAFLAAEQAKWSRVVTAIGFKE